MNQTEVYKLAHQAHNLADRLKRKMWQTAFNKNQEYYHRLEKVYLKAFKRYERRYSQIRQNN